MTSDENEEMVLKMVCVSDWYLLLYEIGTEPSGIWYNISTCCEELDKFVNIIRQP
jgi:hypothetical protein